ncbi:hypothetical protein PTTW11_04370 [Pyrenophora teres f. teres]|uniref:Uncharacterized protein n=1 Tax=Pyrenophora teres f. teres TaxID=97479 RepID=A0A6S6VZ18_9PLEO|nr:hypothetical protein PTTW11_04370 [Pyrenophora teres f. teres]
MNRVSLWFLTPRYPTLASSSSGARFGPSSSPQHITPPRVRTLYSASHAPWRADSDVNQRTNSVHHKGFSEFYFPLGPIPSNVHDLVPLSRRLQKFSKRKPFDLNEDPTGVTGLMDRVGEGGLTIANAIDFYADEQHDAAYDAAYEVARIDSMIVRLQNALTANKHLVTLHQKPYLRRMDYSMTTAFTRYLMYRKMMLQNLTEYPNDKFTSEEKVAMEAAIAKATGTARLAPETGLTLRVLVSKLRRLDTITSHLVEYKREIRSQYAKMQHLQRAPDDARSPRIVPSYNDADTRFLESLFKRQQKSHASHAKPPFFLRIQTATATTPTTTTNPPTTA